MVIGLVSVIRRLPQDAGQRQGADSRLAGAQAMLAINPDIMIPLFRAARAHFRLRRGKARSSGTLTLRPNAVLMISSS